MVILYVCYDIESMLIKETAYDLEQFSQLHFAVILLEICLSLPSLENFLSKVSR